MMSICVLIFSRDRAMQLDATLRSFFLHCKDSQLPQIYVLYKSTSNQHHLQYQILRDNYPEVNFVKQGQFRRDVLRIVNPYPFVSFSALVHSVVDIIISAFLLIERVPTRVLQGVSYLVREKLLKRFVPVVSGNQFLLFLVDDNLFVKDFSLEDILETLGEHPDALGFSLRLGTNITHCYMLDQPQSLPEFTPLDNLFMKFDWTVAELDFAYPLEVSSSIYRTRDVFPIIATQPFVIPNLLESQLASSADSFATKMPSLICPRHSYTFCNAINLVQTVASNKAGVDVGYTSDHLADLFDQGYRIRVDAYSGFVPNGCHQEVPLEFYQPEAGGEK